jgi:DNA-binding FadR family transcriptional regulator
MNKNGKYSVKRETIRVLNSAGLLRVRGGANISVPPQMPNTQETSTNAALECTGGGTGNRSTPQTDGFVECVI